MDVSDFLKHFRTEVLPHMEASAFVVSVCPTGKIDVKFCLEIGAAIMLNKPIIAVITPGTSIPEKLSRVVDRFIEYDPSDVLGMERRFAAAVSELLPKLRGT